MHELQQKEDNISKINQKLNNLTNDLINQTQNLEGNNFEFPSKIEWWELRNNEICPIKASNHLKCKSFVDKEIVELDLPTLESGKSKNVLGIVNSKCNYINELKIYINDVFLLNASNTKAIEEQTMIIKCKTNCNNILKENKQKLNGFPDIVIQSQTRIQDEVDVSDLYCVLLISNNINKANHENKIYLRYKKSNYDHNEQLQKRNIESLRLLANASKDQINEDEDKVTLIIYLSTLLPSFFIFIAGIILFTIVKRRRKLEEEKAKLLVIMQRNDLVNKILLKFVEVNDSQCKAEDIEECPICLTEFDNTEKILESPCHHFFHFKCIYQWIDLHLSESKCPMCNYDIPKNESIPRRKKEINPDSFHVQEIIESDKGASTTKGLLKVSNPTNHSDTSIINLEHLKVGHIILR